MTPTYVDHSTLDNTPPHGDRLCAGSQAQCMAELKEQLRTAGVATAGEATQQQARSHFLSAV